MTMKIYVDFDDCLCETARSFSKLAIEMFDKHVSYEEIKFFELDKTFNLDEDQFERFMAKGHEPEVLLSYDETPGASKVINEWLDEGRLEPAEHPTREIDPETLKGDRPGSGFPPEFISLI